MSLATYKRKRSFSDTPEPSGGKAKGSRLHFVVQKHDATHLHYDFRLEMEGVLKSWAVPKGPSADPEVKRLAMMVEDHPYDYRTFEGIIPKGQYGGGTVIVWDEGTYEPAETKTGNKKSAERNLLQQLRKGKIVFTLHGKKMKGDYALVKSSYQGGNSWLLMKMKDKYARKADITGKDKSVISGKTISQMEKDPDKIYGQKTNRSKSARRINSKTPGKPVTKAIGVKAKFPRILSPMLATLVDKPFDSPNWIYEIKWDGYRALAFLRNGKVDLRSRNNKSFNEKFYPVADALGSLGLMAVLDGEVIVSSEAGVSNFGQLQNWRSEADGELQYYVFDLLWYDGYSLLDLPLLERRDKLREILPAHPRVHLSEAFDTGGTEFYEAAKKLKLEGIIAKKADSIYSPGIRSKEWLKIKVSRRQEVVIGGFTKNKGSSKVFSALLTGVFKKGKLLYTGKIGTGFSDKVQREMMKQFRPLITDTIPFDVEPDVNKPSRFRPNPPQAVVTWLRPELVCEVSFTEMTSDDIMRHPSFEGMREDKKASEVIAEKAVATKRIIKKPKRQKKASSPKQKK